MTEKRTRQRGFLPTQQGLEILEARRQAKGYSYATLSEAAGLNSEDQVKRLFHPHWGYKVQRDGIEKIAKALELQPTEFIDDWLAKGKTYRQQSCHLGASEINWREVCRVMLAKQQQERRIRRKATERGFEIQIHVPLGLVKRKQQQRRAGMIPVEGVYDLEGLVITRIYQHDEFLETALGKNVQGENQHMAIVGEPGAGKTTLLERIATYIQNQTLAVPIWISLADLQGKTLQEYLLENWLPEALERVDPDLDVEMPQRQSLQKWLRKGGVWLLLDGVDEMGSVGGFRLQEIRHQLRDGWGRVRVVLTCRSNVWDAQINNHLTGFDTYKIQEFDQENIEDFINQWFSLAEDDRTGEALQIELNKPQYQRLFHILKNPLMLSFLCQIVSRDERAKLPEIKADLYQLFVRYFYEWKPTQEIDWTTQPKLQNELHQALGQLSIAGLESSYRFRLPLSLIQQEMEERLFKLAWELGWLNLVDREAETDEPVYAFFHPTFQEYFAALATDDWHFFLSHVPDRPHEGTYRVFESQWKEVIILWASHSINRYSKTSDFLENLSHIDFSSEVFIDLYEFRKFSLLAEIADAINDSESLNRVLDKLMQWGFYDFPETSYFIFKAPIALAVHELLVTLSAPQINELMVEMTQTCQSETFRLVAARILQNRNTNIFTVKSTLQDLSKNGSNDCIKSKAAMLLNEILPMDPDLINIISAIAKKTDELDFSFLCYDFLKETIGQGISSDWTDEYRLLINLIEHLKTLNNLDYFDDIYSQDILSLDFKTKQKVCLFALMMLWYSQVSKIEIYLRFYGLVKNVYELSKNNEAKLYLSIFLCYFMDERGLNTHTSNRSIIKFLIERLLHTEDKDELGFICDTIKLISRPELLEFITGYLGNLQIDSALYNIELECSIYKILCHCAEHLNYPNFYRAWHDMDGANSTSVQRLNLCELPTSLRAELANERELEEKIHLICIDASQFSDRDRPAADIYIEMVEQNCPQCPNGTPTTLQQLKTYWRLDLKTLKKTPVLVFYSSKSDCDFSETFMTTLNTFGGAIAIICDRHYDKLCSISTDRLHIIQAILSWLRRTLLEA